MGPWPFYVNVSAPTKAVRHSELERAERDSPYRSVCPVCNQGLLLVHRDDSLHLRRIDRCTVCCQRFFYVDDEIAGEPLPALVEAVPGP